MRYRLGISLGILAAVFFDSVVFPRFNIAGVAPDCVLVLVVSIGILKGATEAAATGCIVGIIIDILFGRAVGINAMAYMLSGVAGGLFYKKYYADNLVIPVLTVAFCAFFKENVMAFMTMLVGGKFAYFEMLITYIVPTVALSAALCLPVHHLIKPSLARSGKKRYDRAAGGSR